MEKPNFFRVAKNSCQFTWNQKKHLLRVLWPLLPWILLYSFGATIGSVVLMAAGYKFWIALLFLSGCILLAIPVYAVFIIAWHRAYLSGPSDANLVDLWHLQKVDWEFIGYRTIFLFSGMIVYLICALGIGATGFLAWHHTSPFSLIMFFASVVVMFIIMALLQRLTLYFPAKVVGHEISAFKAGKGLGTRMLCANLVILIPMMIITGICSYWVMSLPLDTIIHRPHDDILVVAIQNFLDVAITFIPTMFGQILIVTNVSQFYHYVGSRTD